MEIAIAKYRNDPSLKVITRKMEKLRSPKFDLTFISYKETVNEANNLKNRKVFQKNRDSCTYCQGKYRYCFLFLLS